jgi:hypothetical protein
MNVYGKPCVKCGTEVSGGREMSAAYDNGKRYPRAAHTPERCAQSVAWNNQNAEARATQERQARAAAAPLRFHAILVASGMEPSEAMEMVLSAVRARMGM